MQAVVYALSVCILQQVSASSGDEGQTFNFHTESRGKSFVNVTAVASNEVHVNITFTRFQCNENFAWLISGDRFMSIYINCTHVGINVTPRRTAEILSQDLVRTRYRCGSTCTQQRSLLLKFTKSTRTTTMASKPESYLPRDLVLTNTFSSDIKTVSAGSFYSNTHWILTIRPHHRG